MAEVAVKGAEVAEAGAATVLPVVSRAVISPVAASLEAASAVVTGHFKTILKPF
jgi:hypothetical protein